MKFWVKIFLGVISIFVIAFAAGALFLTNAAFNLNREREVENGIREHSVILSSIESRILTISHIHPDIALNAARLAAAVKPLAEYYSKQNVLLALYYKEHKIYSDLPKMNEELLRIENKENKKHTDVFHEGKRYLLVSSAMEEYPHLTFIYARDISQIDDFRVSISNAFRLISGVVLLLMGALIYLLLRYITAPIGKLNKITAEIAGGNYSKRADVDRNDELGTLARSFNLMADSVEENMERLTKAAEDKQQFIDNLTHEMKTPLTAISGYAEYLQNARFTEEERATAAGHLHEMAQRLENLSGKLLDLAFMRGENITLKPCNMANIFEALKKTSPNVEIENSMTAEINGDEALLLSMLTNLAENAARASAEGDKIVVKAYDNIIEVIDTGHGMEPSEIEKITAPFYRVDASRSRRFGGVGLGLSIVSQIAQLHNAEIEINSVPEKGTTVKISFTTVL